MGTYDYSPRPIEVEDKVRAWTWYEQHREHVDRLVRAEGRLMCPPRGSDCIRPELWKPTHWRWLFAER